MKLRHALLISVCAFAAAGNIQAAYILGTPSATVNTDGWALSESNMAGLNSALTDPANFGPGGIAPESISIVTLTTFAPGDLSGLNGMLVPWWQDSQSGPFAAAIIAAFNAGMDLILLEDDTDHDFIGESLGLPTSFSDGSGSTAAGPFASGPFGVPGANAVLQNGNTGQKDLATILALGGFAGATNGSGEVTAAYWARGTFNGNANAGALLIFGDVDMASIYSAEYPPTANDNGIFVLNGIASVVSGQDEGPGVPEPGTWLLVASGVGLLAIVKRAKV